MIGWLILASLALAGGPIEAGDAAFLRGDLPAALVAWSEEVVAARKARDVGREGTAWLRVAAALRRMGRLEESAERRDKAARLLGAEASNVGMERALWLEASGAYVEAEAAYLAVFRQMKASGDASGAMVAALNLGQVRAVLGLDNETEALAAARSLAVALKDHESEAAISLAEGDRALRAGDARGALAAAKLATASPGVAARGWALSARAYSAMGQVALAIAAYQQGIAASEAGMNALEQAELVEGLGLLYLGERDMAPAIVALKAAHGHFRRAGEAGRALRLGLMLSDLTGQSAQMWEAQAAGLPASAALLAVLRARELGAAGELREAEALLAGLGDSGQLDEVVWRASWARAVIAGRREQWGVAAAEMRRALVGLDASRARGGLLGAWAQANRELVVGELLWVGARSGAADELAWAAMATENRPAGAAGLQGTLSTRLVAALDAAAPAEQVAALESQLAKARVDFAAGVDALRARGDALKLATHIAPEDLEAALSGLPAGVMVLQPVVLADQLVLLCFERGRARLVEVPVSAAKLGEVSDRFARLLRAGESDAEAVELVASQLGEWLIKPVLAQVDASDTLIIARGGPLAGIPVAALRVDGRYVVERVAVLEITHVGSLASLSAPVKAVQSSVLLVGDPDGSLPGARREVSEIAALWGGAEASRVLSGPAGGREAVLGGLGGQAVVHLATHGVVDRRTPEASYLVLGPDPEAGRLLYGEIPGLAPRLGGTRLVVLSACESGVAVRASAPRADGGIAQIAGLAAQFRRAGVPTLMGTLWRVDDEATRALMVGFYRGYLAGEPAALALAHAQRELLSDPRTAHPWYWAGFTVVGDWR